MSDFHELENILNIKFNDENILQLSLTHKSNSFPHNDRLEFLGDAILNFIVSNYLFDKFSDASAGDLSRLKSYIVSEDYLTIVARSLKLGKFFRLGKGEVISNGSDKPSILSSGLEAIIAAIYISNGLNCTKIFILEHFKLDSIPFEKDNNYKGKLQTFTLKLNKSLPVYSTFRKNNIYNSEVIIDNKKIAEGSGKNKKKAENSAAEHALQKLNII